MGSLRVAVVFGGRSGEHEVSVVSARFVAEVLASRGYRVVPMAVDRAGRWAQPDEALRALEESGSDPSQVVPFDGALPLDGRLLDRGVDVVFPVLHGPFGEDGTVQGLCEVLDLPYVGCGVEASAVTMNKARTKQVLTSAGVATPAFVSVTARQWRDDADGCGERVGRLQAPWFVKPARMGSSVGITKVKRSGDLAAAVERALVFDDLVVVEEGISGREIEVAVLGSDPERASVPGEVVPGHEFYDYEDKYLDDACELIAPAPLGEAESDEARRMAVEVFRVLGCEGMARVDFLLDARSGSFLVNEVNTIPGFTSISMYPRLMQLSGVEPGELVDALVDLARSRHGRRSALAAAALRPLDDRRT